MTQTQITQTAQQDDAATMAFIAQIQAADTDTAAGMLEALLAATRANTVADVLLELREFGETGAVEVVKNNF